MQLKKLLVAFIFCLTFPGIHAQKLSVGVSCGLTSEYWYPQFDEYFHLDESFHVAGMIEYSPKRAIFSVSSGIHFLSYRDQIQVPFECRFNFGNRVSPHIGAGFITQFFYKPIESGTGFSYGLRVGAGFDVMINQRIAISTDFYGNFLSYWWMYPYKWGPSYPDLQKEFVSMISIGLKYFLITPQEE